MLCGEGKRGCWRAQIWIGCNMAVAMTTHKNLVLCHKSHVNKQQPLIEYTMQATQYTLQKYLLYTLETGQNILHNKMLILALKQKPSLVPQWEYLHALGKQMNLATIKSIKVLNVHKAYNIRVGLFVESLVSNPSTQARPRQQERKEERRTVLVSNGKHSDVS